MSQTTEERFHIVEGSDWKDAVIALLDSRSPYRPWRHGFGVAHEGDPVAIVLNTDPPCIMTALGKVGTDGRLDRAVVEWPEPGPGLLDLATLTAVVDFADRQDPRRAWQLHGEAAIQLERALTECKYRDDPAMRLGHSSVTTARVLLHSRGRCTGCGGPLALTGEEARDAIHIRTVDPAARAAPEVLITEERGGHPSYASGPIPDNCWRPELPADWPGVLCGLCHTRMQEGGYTNLLDFRFSQHPNCPRCWAKRTQSALFGMLGRDVDVPPWRDIRGCCRTDDIWTCAMCMHKW